MKHRLLMLCTITIAIASIVCPCQSPAAELPLATAVERFNARAKVDPVGAAQPALTVDETVAAIRGWIRKHHPAPDEYYQAFQSVAETMMLPPGARLDFTTGWKNYNGYDFVVWWVDLTLPDPAATNVDPATTGSYTFRIRDRKISSAKVATTTGRTKIQTDAGAK